MIPLLLGEQTERGLSTIQYHNLGMTVMTLNHNLSVCFEGLRVKFPVFYDKDIS